MSHSPSEIPQVYLGNEAELPYTGSFQPTDGHVPVDSDVLPMTATNQNALDVTPQVFSELPLPETSGEYGADTDAAPEAAANIQPLPKVRVEPLHTEGSPQPVPRYVYPPYVVDAYPDLIRPTTEHLRTAELSTAAKEIADHSYAERTGIIQDTIVEWGEHLGIDLRSRRVEPNHVHFYDREQYEVARYGGGLTSPAPEGSVGVTTGNNHILMWALEGNDRQTLSTTNHEMIHAYSYIEKDIDLEEVGDQTVATPVTLRAGYENKRTGAFAGFTETLTEVTNYDLMVNKWASRPDLAPLLENSYDMGYESGVIFFDGLMKNRFENPKAALEIMQKGMLTGNTGNLRVLHEAIGTEGMKEIAAMTLDDDEKIAAMAERLGMPDTARKIREQDTSGVLDWV